MTVKSDSIGKFVELGDATAPSSVPCRAETIQDGMFVKVCDMFRLASYETCGAFVAVFEGACERAFLMLSVLHPIYGPELGSEDTNSGPLGDIIPSDDTGGFIFGISAGRFTPFGIRLPSHSYAEAIEKCVKGLVECSSATSTYDQFGLRIFVPFVLGEYEGSSWTRRTPATAADLIPQITNDSGVATTKGAGKAVCEALAKFALCNEANYTGRGDDALAATIAQWLGLSAPEGVTLFEHFIGGRDSASATAVDEVKWNKSLEGREISGDLDTGFLSSRSRLWRMIVHALADGDATWMAKKDDPSSAWNRIARFGAVCPFESPGTYQARPNGFVIAASAVALARIAPFGLFLLEENYATRPSGRSVSRLNAGIAHEFLDLTCTYRVTCDDTGNVSIARNISGATTFDISNYYTTYAGAMKWDVSGASWSAVSGSVKFSMAVNVSFKTYISNCVSGNLDMGASAAFADAVSPYQAASTSMRSWSGDGIPAIFGKSTGTVNLYEIDPGSVAARAMTEGSSLRPYTEFGDSTVSSSPATGSASIFAKMPIHEDPSKHGSPDLNGLHAFPCKATFYDGYASGGNLWSFWTGTVAGAGTGDENPVYAIPKAAFTLGYDASGNATETERTAFKSDHIDAARVAAEKAFPVLRANDTYTVTDANGEETTKSRHYLFSRASIESVAKYLNDHFPSETELQANSSVNIGTPNIQDWTYNATGYYAAAIWFDGDDYKIYLLKGGSRFASDSDISGYQSCDSIDFVASQKEGATFCPSSLMQEKFADLEESDPWSAQLKFGGCLGAFDWNWKAIKLGE